MSQAGIISSSSSPPPPTVLETLTGATGTNPVPVDANNNINLFGDTTAPGIITRGDVATNTVFFGLEKPVACGTGTTIDVSTADLVTISLGASAATYSFEALIAGKAVSAHGIGGTAVATFRTNGVAATLINTVDIFVNKDLVIAGASFNLVASGNDVILRATGSLGAVISWNGCVSYLSVVAGV